MRPKAEGKALGMPGGSAERGRRAVGPEEPAGAKPPRGGAAMGENARYPQFALSFSS